MSVGASTETIGGRLRSCRNHLWLREGSCENPKIARTLNVMNARDLISIHEEGILWRRQLEAEEAVLEAVLRRSRHILAPVPHPVPGLSPIPEIKIQRRGVYVAPFLSRRGRYVLYAVDRRGLYVARTIVQDDSQWANAFAATRGFLDELDPSPVSIVR